jgi:hypothetical protein
MGKKNAAVIEDPEPVLYSRGVIPLSYTGIIAAGGGSLTYNIYHAHAANLPLPLAVIFGVLPPFFSTIMAHFAVGENVGALAQSWICSLTAAFMGISAFATSSVTRHVSGLGVGIAFSLTVDAASMTCLVFLFRASAKLAEHRQWAARTTAAAGSQNHGQPAGTISEPLTPVLQNHGSGSQNHGSGSQNHGSGSQNHGSGSQNHAPEPPCGSENQLPASGTTPELTAGDAGIPALEPGSARALPPAAPDLKALRTAIVAEFAARPRPLESAEHRAVRVRALLAEFAERAGCQMSVAELGRAEQISKAAAGQLRASAAGPDEATAEMAV